MFSGVAQAMPGMPAKRTLLLLVCLVSCACTCLAWRNTDWRSCAGSAAAFNIQAVNLEPNTVAPGGTVSLVVDVFNKHPSVTAGSAQVKVYYYGFWVLTASGTMCDGPSPPSAASQEGAASTASSRDSSVSMAHRRALHGISSSSSSSSSWTSWTWLGTTQLLEHGTRPLERYHAPSNSVSSSLSSRKEEYWPHRLAVKDDTCVLPAGPLQLHHDASLPGLAPRGNYRMQLSAADALDGQELLCVDVWFKVA